MTVKKVGWYNVSYLNMSFISLLCKATEWPQSLLQPLLDE